MWVSMRSLCAKALSVLAGGLLLQLAGGEPAQARPDQPGADDAARETWIVRLTEPPLARYRGGLAGLAPTHARTLGRRRLDPGSSASRAYLHFLDRRHDQIRASIDARCGRAVPVLRRFRAAVNGLAVRLSEAEAGAVRGVPGVRDVVRDTADAPDTDRGPLFIRADDIWPGGSTGADTLGEGVVIGILDTGINGTHASFANPGPVDGHAYTNPLGDGVFLGRCDLHPSHPDYYPHCNNKLIGAYSFSGDDDPEDEDGHGSHVASTAAGNLLTVFAPVVNTVNPSLVYDISGVARHANLVMYEVCAPHPVLCTNSARVAAVDQAILNGVVDVLNHSIDNGGSPWTNVVSEAFLDATEAGIFVAQSAGNDGPAPATLNSGSAPWTASVANQSHDRVHSNTLMSLTASGGLADISGFSLSAGTGGPFEIVYAGDQDVGGQTFPLCADGPTVFPPDGSSNPFPAGFFTGKIVICDRGTYARVEKGFNVDEAGAAGYILANDASTGDSLVADDHYLPSIHITHTDGAALKAWLGVGGPTFTGEITGAVPGEDPAFGDLLASSSSRGPHPNAPEVIKPDLSAPGTSILAAVQSGFGGDEVDFLWGTSMASPHVAGAAALLRAVHPTWSPAEIKSALMLSAKAGVLKEDGITPGDPFDQGSGRVHGGDAARALLVMEETSANFQAADPAMGGDPTSLNLASLADPGCDETCNWSRTFRNVSGGFVEFDIVQSAGGPDVILTPDVTNFTLAGGASQAIQFTAAVLSCPPGGCGPSADWIFGEFELQVLSSPLGSAGDLDLHVPVAIIPLPEPDPLLALGSGVALLMALARLGRIGNPRQCSGREVSRGEAPGPVRR
jgi:subtilisin family serine protease